MRPHPSPAPQVRPRFRLRPIIGALLLAVLMVPPGCKSPPSGPVSSAARPAPSVGPSLDIPTDARPVTAGMIASPAEIRAGDAFDLVVTIAIAPGHHLYADKGPDSPFIPTTLSLTLPPGLESLGDWARPQSIRRTKGERVYIDSARFVLRVRASSTLPAGVLPLAGELHCQACTEELCWPPQTLPLATSLRISANPR